MCYNVSSPTITHSEERSNTVTDEREVIDALNNLRDEVEKYETEVSNVSQELDSKIDTLNDLNGGLQNDLDTLTGYLESMYGIEEVLSNLTSNIDEAKDEIGG